MRFVLALWVIVHHLTGRGQELGEAIAGLPAPVYLLLRGGYLAVSVFFALSGFVLARNYGAKQWTGRSIYRYAAGRVARVYPVYLLSLALVWPFIAADKTPGKGFYIGAYTALVQGWLGGIPVNWNTPAWSLSCEMFFYAAFPLLALFFRRPSWSNTLIAGAAACVLTRAMWAAGIPDGVKPLVHLSDFLMGLAAASAYELLVRGGRISSGARLYIPALCASIAVVAFPGVLPGWIDLNTALRPLNGLMLAGLAMGGGLLARMLSARIPVYLGKASYSMYILHVPMMWWYRRWSHTFSPALYVAAVIAISALIYGVFEEPANRRIRRILAR